MFGSNWLEALILVGALGIGGAMVTYVVLRLFVWSKAQSRSLENIRNHALWTGLIAWACSSLTGAASAGIYAPTQLHTASDPWSIIPWAAILIPPIAVVAVHAIGQATWPIPRSPQRMAVLEFRRAHDYIQPALGWTVLGVFVFSAAILGVTFLAPGFAPSPLPTANEGHLPAITVMGRVPGYVLGTALTTALAILFAGTVLVLRLIARRRSLESLTSEQNKTLRSIGVNRLLRVAATVAAGLASIAGEFLARPTPASGTTSWNNWVGLVNVAVLVAMLFWKPPFLDTETADAGYNTLYGRGGAASAAVDDGPAAARFTDSSSAVAFPSAALGAALGLTLINWIGWLGPLFVATIFALLSHVAMEFVLRRNYAGPGTARTPLRAAVPGALLVAIIVSIIGLIPALTALGSIDREGLYQWHGIGSLYPRFLAPMLCSLAILLTGILAARIVWFRPGLTNVAAALDRTLRRRALFRIARTVGGGLFAVLGGVLINIGTAPTINGSGPDSSLGIVGAACLVVAVILFFYPVRGFTPDDFKPSHSTSAAPGAKNISIGK
ncbi:hypothetical protein MB46_13665 [Arthrobacter alpinus]|uniref:hypothetical protein n=1 Tax=Arthrobacter alpinus TaxID=656366 RepID=UPI0005C9161C|nr:hypothetical protein [Arthrobacter alpinus]ALV46376.1 hypothetical protein MB46_13665 [Arthrobacter alpinus]